MTGAGGQASPVVVLGSGRLAATLAAALAAAGHEVLDAAAEQAARAELIVLTGSGQRVAERVSELARADLLRERHGVVHTAPAPGLEPLRRAALAGAGTAACHPVVRLADGPADPAALHGVGWAVTADPPQRRWARRLVERLGGRPFTVHDEDRPVYAAGIAVATQAVGAAVATARQLLLGARVGEPAQVLAPLVRAGVEAVLADGAQAVEGPVADGDVDAVARQLQALDAAAPRLAAAYRQLGAAVLEQVRPGLDDRVAARLQAQLHLLP